MLLHVLSLRLRGSLPDILTLRPRVDTVSALRLRPVFFGLRFVTVYKELLRNPALSRVRTAVPLGGSSFFAPLAKSGRGLQ